MSGTGNKSLFECYVCYSFYNNDYRKPKYLKCHHTVCLDCIYKTTESSPLGVKCPFCREWTELESTDVNKALRTNQDILDFMEIWLFKLTNNVDSPSLGRDRDTDYNPAITPTKLRWCCPCQQLALNTCQDNSHRTLIISPAVLKLAQEAMSQGRQSQANWEEAITKRGNLKAIVTSIQSSLNRLKDSVDTLVEENERALAALRACFEDVTQSVNAFDPSAPNVDLKGFVIQSEHDLTIATDSLEKWSSFDGAHVSVALESPHPWLMNAYTILDGVISWVENTSNVVKKEDGKMPESEIDFNAFLLDARRLIGFLVASVPNSSVPNVRRGKAQRKPKRSSNPLPSARPINLSLSSHTPHRANAPPLRKVLSEPTYPPSKGHWTEYISTCAWNPTESVLASTGKNGSAALSFDPDFNHLTPLSFEGIQNVGSNQPLEKGGGIHRLAWNPKGTQLVTGSKDGWISFWTLSGTSLYQQKQHNQEIMAMTWNPEGKLLATAGRNTVIKIWNAIGQNAVQSFTYHSNAVCDIQWQSENTFASCDISGKMFFGDIRLVNKPQFAYTGHKDWVKCLHWDPEHFLLASCSVDTTVKIWTPLVPPFLQEYTGHSKSVNAVEWSPTGPGSLYPNANRYLASCSDDQTAQILDVSKHAVVHKLETKTKPSRMTCLSFSCDGKLLATGNENGVVEIWNAHNGRVVHTFADFGSSINKIAWQKDGTKLAIAIQDKPCGIVDIKNNKQNK
ncbi:uncharacterized protein LOC130702697 [Daphnia carinata]|uniref:uncharacterized protein LOC130702697 n=1 Tax=Daphnia carinata TaxID=120202 RepID=UPI00257F3DC0|nr:uncharacterized protein LOC130702697 [Daphnia carinata]